MKTSTLCLGCLSLTLLAAGLCGVVDASHGPRPASEGLVPPLARASDALAARVTPHEVPSTSISAGTVKAHAAKRAVTLRTIHVDVPPTAPTAPLRALWPAMPAAPAEPATPAAPASLEVSICEVPVDAVFNIAPEWDTQEWRTLNAETLKAFRTINKDVRDPAKAPAASPSGCVEIAKPVARQRA